MQATVKMVRTMGMTRVPIASDEPEGKTLQRIALLSDDVLPEIRDAQTVIDVALETYCNQHDGITGVLDMLAQKLEMIKWGVGGIVELAPYKSPKMSKSHKGSNLEKGA